LLFNFDNTEASTYFGGKSIDVVYMYANHELEVTIEGIIEKQILGVPYRYSDEIVGFMNMKQKYTNTKEIVDEKNEIGALIIIDYDFTEH